ncbi:MAG TPA: GAF domain-containing protein, partial [Nitrolancea sp.]|nr:GAF domain-containing protein [Nitrolancea sp.]
GLNPAATERGESLTVRYPHRLIVPIPAAGGTLGEFYLFRSALQRFSLEETEDARSFASTLAVVLEQTRLRQQQVRQSEILTIQRKLADRLTGAATPEAAAEIGVAICAEAFGSGMASLHRYEEQARRLVMAAACGLPVPFVSGNAHVALGVGACGQAAARRSLVVVEDVAADPDWMSTWHVKEHAVNLGSVWSLPLIGSDDQLLGALTIYHGRPVNAAEHDVILLHLIGQQIATALDRAGLVDRSRER